MGLLAIIVKALHSIENMHPLEGLQKDCTRAITKEKTITPNYDYIAAHPHSRVLQKHRE
jgi:hypothetical protein